MTTRINGVRYWRITILSIIFAVVGWAPAIQADVPEPLLIPVGVPETFNLPDHVVVAQPVRVNQRAMQSPVISILLPDDIIVIADRKNEFIESLPGQQTWIGDVRGLEGEVVVTARGAHFAALITYGNKTYEISRSVGGAESIFELVELELSQLPPEDLGGVPDGGGLADINSSATEPLAENVVQDLLVVYNQNACNKVGGCGQMQTNIMNAVAAMNTAYAESGINITSNLVGMALTSYIGTDTQQALYDLRGTTDGFMDEIHVLRTDLSADLVAMVHDGNGCGIGYLPASAGTAFTVTNYTCLGGNRTLSHEIGHNQGGHHDRVTVGTTSTSTFNYGYRRCNNTSLADNASAPHYRTIMAYSCTNASRVGRFSNPNVNYSGVPQGVDPAVDSAKGAWNAKVLNNSANYVAGFRQSPSTEPPKPPGGLDAVAAGRDSIRISWADNSNDETGFVLQFAVSDSAIDGDWTNIATLGAGSESYSHNGLSPESTYWYRVRAYNSAGSSGYSNSDWATTEPVPAEIPDLALADNSDRAIVSGTYVATQTREGAYQTITEQSSGGPKKRRKQAYSHSWDFDVYGGAGGVMVTVNAWVSGTEGANFWYSTDSGNTLIPMFTVNNTQGEDQTFMLPGGTSKAVLIGVNDAEQSNGEGVDSVYVDYLVITSYTQPVSPPAAPLYLGIDGFTSNSVDLSFIDNAYEEWGFEIWRSTTDLGNSCTDGTSVGTSGGSASAGGKVSFTDDSAQPEQTYFYWATAFNGGGNSMCSNPDWVTTTSAPDLRLDVVSPYKVKGKQKVDLAWTASVEVEVYRDGSPVLLINVVGQSGTDPIDAKGGGSYEYKVCVTSDSDICSEPVMAIF